jgi:hypothetical protein
VQSLNFEHYAAVQRDIGAFNRTARNGSADALGSEWLTQRTGRMDVQSALIAADAEIDAEADDPAALSLIERDRREAEVMGDLLSVERDEVFCLAGAGAKSRSVSSTSTRSHWHRAGDDRVATNGRPFYHVRPASGARAATADRSPARRGVSYTDQIGTVSRTLARCEHLPNRPIDLPSGITE